MIGIGIVGIGGIAQMHVTGIMNEQDIFKLSAVCDTDPARLANFAAKYGIRDTYDDYRKLLANPTIDAVIILVPHNLHEQVCVEAFSYGKHVMVEKPIARTLEEADRIMNAAKNAGKVLMVAHNQRYSPNHLKIRELLEKNEIGELFCARADHFQNFNPPQGSWWRSKEAVGGGCVIGSGIHRLDLLRWYMGEVDEVYASQVYNPHRLEAEVACTAVLKFRSGAIGEFLCNWGIYRYPYGEALSLFGKEGSIYLDSSGEQLMLSSKSVKNGELVNVQPDYKYDTMWAHFAKCIECDEEVLTSGIEGRKSLELVLSINESARTGMPVKLPKP